MNFTCVCVRLYIFFWLFSQAQIWSSSILEAFSSIKCHAIGQVKWQTVENLFKYYLYGCMYVMLCMPWGGKEHDILLGCGLDRGFFFVFFF